MYKPTPRDYALIFIGVLFGVATTHLLTDHWYALIAGGLVGAAFGGYRVTWPFVQLAFSKEFWTTWTAYAVAAAAALFTIVIIVDGFAGLIDRKTSEMVFTGRPTVLPGVLPHVTSVLVAAAEKATMDLFTSYYVIPIVLGIAALWGVLTSAFRLSGDDSLSPEGGFRFARKVNPLTVVVGGLLAAFAVEEIVWFLGEHPEIGHVIRSLLVYLDERLGAFAAFVGPYAYIGFMAVGKIIALAIVIFVTGWCFGRLHFARARGYATDTVIGVICGWLLDTQFHLGRLTEAMVPSLPIWATSALAGGLIGVSIAFLTFRFLGERIAKWKIRVETEAAEEQGRLKEYQAAQRRAIAAA